MIRVGGYEKASREKAAVRGFSVDVPAGGIVGLVGPIGTGESTAMRALAGIILPDSRTIERCDRCGRQFSDLYSALESVIPAARVLMGECVDRVRRLT